MTDSSPTRPAPQKGTGAHSTTNLDVSPPHIKRFGWFSGVFTPSILTILGVIMYLRLGWATGQVGLAGILAIVVLAHLITIATGLSVSSIATNRSVGPGGAYNIISRSLGASSGAAIGIPLFLAQALSVTFYIVGFTESLRRLFPELSSSGFNVLGIYVNLEQCVGLLLLSLLAVISAKSAELAIKAQYGILVIIGVSLVSLFMGGSENPPETIAWTGGGDEGFSAVFAVFFPAVTGIMAGVGMSGDLRNPRRDLPIGSLSAIAVGFVVYLVLPIWLASQASPEELINDELIAWKLARFENLIYLGVWGATISSALGSVLTAPRTLQALANDGLAPGFLGRGSGPSNEPRIGLVVTFLLAGAGILMGDLNAIAPILTMFFLATYGLTNLACGLERWAASPGFRPAFSVPFWISLAGAGACFYVMSIIDLPAMVTALLFCGMIFVLTEQRDLGTTYGDARHGIWAALVRSALLRLRRAEFHPANWRPNLLILGGNPAKRPWLLHFGNAIVQERGLVSYFALLRGSVEERWEHRANLLNELECTYGEKLPNVFFRVDIVRDVYSGIISVAQSYGLGSFEANSIMLGWPTSPEGRSDYARMLRDLVRLDRSLFLVRYNSDRGLGDRKEIHIWWGGLKGNGGLMLLVSSLLRAHEKWRQARVTLITVVENEEMQSAASARKERIIEAARIDATPRVILREGRSIQQVMKEVSSSADLAILGIGLPEPEQDAGVFFDRIDAMLENMPTTLLVHSARTFEGEPVLFEADGEEP